MARMRATPAVLQHFLRSRADRCPPPIWRGYGPPRRQVHLKEPRTSMGPEPAMEYVRRTVWGMLYLDDDCIVSRSPQRLAKMMERIVEVCQPFLFNRVGEEGRGHVHVSTTLTADDGASRSGRANLQTIAIHHLRRGHRDQNPGHVR